MQMAAIRVAVLAVRMELDQRKCSMIRDHRNGVLNPDRRSAFRYKRAEPLRLTAVHASGFLQRPVSRPSGRRTPRHGQAIPRSLRQAESVTRVRLVLPAQSPPAQDQAALEKLPPGQLVSPKRRSPVVCRRYYLQHSATGVELITHDHHVGDDQAEHRQTSACCRNNSG